VADRGDAQSDEIVGREFGQDVAVDIVVAKGLCVLLKPQTLQPVADAFRHLRLSLLRDRPGYCRRPSPA